MGEDENQFCVFEQPFWGLRRKAGYTAIKLFQISLIIQLRLKKNAFTLVYYEDLFFFLKFWKIDNV